MRAEDVTVDGLRLRTWRVGEGQPLLLINGIGASVEMWSPLLPELSGREVIAFDMPGCGRSERLPRPLRMRQLARLVANLMTEVGLERADVLGYSHGGLVAQEFAYRHPDRVARLILCSTSAGMPSVPPSARVMRAMLTPARYHDPRAAAQLVPLLAGGRTRRDPRLMRAQLRLRLAHPPSVAGYAHQLFATWGWSSHRWLHRIAHEALVLHGAEDPLVPLVNARYLAWNLPGATLHVMRGAGHLLLLDEAPASAMRIRRFLDGG